MNTILVTGCAGFIGSNLTEFLLKRGYRVIGIDNFNNYYSPKIKHYNLKDFKENPNFLLLSQDLTNYDFVKNLFEKTKIDAVIHLAAYAGVTYSFEKPLLYVKNNEEVTANLLEMCSRHNVSNFIFASTSSVYGNNPTPFVESMSSDFPLAPYPASKKASEVMSYVYSKTYDINVAILRLFNPLGLRIRPDLALTKLVRSAIFGDEFPQYQDLNSTGRDYCDLDNIMISIHFLLQNPVKYEIFNLGNSSPTTLGGLVEVVNEVTGKRVNLVRMPERLGEMQLTFADSSKAEKLIKYNTKTPLKKIVEKYYNWYLNQEEWYQKGNY
jgi:UDP-glucuronate 4-epimerase